MGETLNQGNSLYAPIFWNIGFVSRPKETFWDRFCPDWGRHVLAWAYSADLNCWVVINPKSYTTLVSIVPFEEIDDYLTRSSGGVLTIVQIRGNGTTFYSNRLVQTCSSVLARIVGVKGRSLTPGQFFRTLMAEGGELKEDPYHVYQSESAGRRP